ncbi:hypothetical protein PENTCL1PPCAC_26019, partial [Pristionchus entomophagus]
MASADPMLIGEKTKFLFRMDDAVNSLSANEVYDRIIFLSVGAAPKSLVTASGGFFLPAQPSAW